MKKIVNIILFFLLSLNLFAQTSDHILRFLNIPIDGKRSDMITAIKKRGFEDDTYYPSYVGVFNKHLSLVNIETGKNGKVYRIFIVDYQPRSKKEVIKQYNKLVLQFKNSEKYIELNDNSLIPDDENLYCEMQINKNNYDSYFFLKPSKASKKYNRQEDPQYLVIEKSYIDILREQPVSSMINKSYHDSPPSYSSYYIPLKNSKPVLDDYIAKCDEIGITGMVWFKIAEANGEFFICIYYDNLMNQVTSYVFTVGPDNDDI